MKVYWHHACLNEMMDVPHLLRNTSISVVMATCNGEKYLSDQLSSILNQSRTPDELVVFDDASDDKTVEILTDFKSNAPFHVLIRVNPMRLGYLTNFAHALQVAKGDLIFLADQDDVWHYDKIERISNWLEANPKIQVVIHDLEFCQENLKPIGQRKIERISSYADPFDSYVTGAATAVRRSFLELCYPFPAVDSIGHDEWIHNCAYSLRVKGIMHDVLALYRRHDSNTTAGSLLNVNHITTRRDFKRGASTVDTRPTLHTRRISLELQAEWLITKKQDIIKNNFIDPEDLSQLQKETEAKINWIKNRQKILSRPRISRLASIAFMLLRGGYQQFSGWKSAAKDALVN